jgi:nitrogenase molybdenum-iron protein NifN
MKKAPQIDDTDFETIQAYVKELNANILIGNSDGKVITEKEGVPLVRIGFPIHDRVGGQRLAYAGYNGTMQLLDNKQILFLKINMKNTEKECIANTSWEQEICTIKKHQPV